MKFIFLLSLIFIFTSTSYSLANDVSQKNYKDFIFDNSMKPAIAMNLNKIKKAAQSICGEDVYYNKVSCKFELMNQEIIILRADDNKKFIYNIKSNTLRDY